MNVDDVNGDERVHQLSAMSKTLFYLFVLISSLVRDPRTSRGPGCVSALSRCPRKGETEQNCFLLFLHSLLVCISLPSFQDKQVLRNKCSNHIKDIYILRYVMI